MMFGLLNNKKEEISRTNPGYEERERRTTFTGIILLLVMFVAGLFFGWRAVSDLERVPKAPPPLSYCSGEFKDGDDFYRRAVPSYEEDYYYDYRSYGNSEGNCTFNQVEESCGMPAV